MALTDDPKDPRLKHGIDESPVPQNEAYLILSQAERSRGFIRPVRLAYKHVGRKVCGKTRAFESTLAIWVCVGEVDHEGECTAFTKAASIEEAIRVERSHRLPGGCGTVTSIAQSIAETFARDPKFYGATYCVCCQMHRPVNEFEWLDDNAQVGS